MNSGFDGATVLLTGAPAPFVLTMARRLGNEGAALAFVGRAMVADDDVRRLLYQFRRKSVVLSADLADPESVAGAVWEAEYRLGPVELLIHALGSPVAVAEPSERGLVLRNSTVPLAAALTCTRTALDLMDRRRHGHVVHVVSSSQIGALEIERAALAGLASAYAPRGGGSTVSISAVYLDESATLPRCRLASTLGRVLESYTGRLVEEEEWTERVLRESEIGDLIIRVCTQAGSAGLANVQTFGLEPGGRIRKEDAWVLSRAA